MRRLRNLFAHNSDVPRFTSTLWVGRGRWLRSLIQRHALLAFFGLTFALSWSIWGLASLLADGDPIAARRLNTIAAYGPTLAAIALARLLRPERQPAVWSRHRRWLVGGVLIGTVGLNSTLAPNLRSSTLLAVLL